MEENIMHILSSLVLYMLSCVRLLKNDYMLKNEKLQFMKLFILTSQGFLWLATTSGTLTYRVHETWAPFPVEKHEIIYSWCGSPETLTCEDGTYCAWDN